MLLMTKEFAGPSLTEIEINPKGGISRLANQA